MNFGIHHYLMQYLQALLVKKQYYNEIKFKQKERYEIVFFSLYLTHNPSPLERKSERFIKNFYSKTE